MFLLTAFAVCCLLPGGALAGSLQPVNADRHGAAVHGYDVVGYFDAGEPVPGNPGIDYVWNGATWWFSTQKNLALFRGNPEKYAPRYGGYCAFAVSRGYTADIDPEAWTVHEGDLYLNYNKKYRKRWLRDIPGNIKKADANWPGVLEKER
jgi:YHS domain-containing protein